MDLMIKELIKLFNEYFTLFIVFPTITCFGIYLTYKLQCIQFTKLKLGFNWLFKKDGEGDGNISYFEAISAILAGNFGTGNISGMAVALTAGGPGALVWMWITAFLGAIIQYASCLLSIKYRKLNENNEYIGGPMCYLHGGLGFKTLAAVFALFTICGAFTVGNLAQVNSITLPLKALGVNPLLCGIVIAIIVAFVTLGGIKRVAKFASIFVPLKASLYLGTTFVILALNYQDILPAFKLMFSSAFNFNSVTGGVMGYGIVKAITTGLDRGIFATDAGTGLVPILQANAKSKNPVIDGAITLIAPLMVMVVCTATGLVLLVTGAWQIPELQSTNMVSYAFEKGLNSSIGSYIVILSLVFFAYTTILAWGCCGEKAISFLGGSKAGKWFQRVYILAIPIGALAHVEWVWLLADVSISLMVITNLIGVIGLSQEVIQDSHAFFPKKNADETVKLADIS